MVQGVEECSFEEVQESTADGMFSSWNLEWMPNDLLPPSNERAALYASTNSLRLLPVDACVRCVCLAKNVAISLIEVEACSVAFDLLYNKYPFI